MAGDIGSIVGRIAAGKSKSTVSKRQMDLAESFMPWVVIVPVYARVMDYILRGWQTYRDFSVICYDVNANSTRSSWVVEASCVMEGGTVRWSWNRQEITGRHKV